MRIVVNDIAASTGGALTVLKNFYNCVREYGTDDEWIFLLGDELLEETENIKVIALPKVKRSRIEKMRFDFFTGKKYISALKPDVVISLQNIITFGLKIPQVLYLHQAIPFQKVKRFSFFKKSERSLAVCQHFIGAIIKKSVKNAEKVIVQTEWLKRAVAEECRISLERIEKIPPNVNMLFGLSSSQTECGRASFFYPTATAIYKNNQTLLEACKILNEKGHAFECTLTLNGGAEIKGVEYTGRLEYKDVIESYQKSVLVFPSYIESFGLPLAEARELGAVILASDCEFSHELLDGYKNAYFFNPFSPEDLAMLMENVILGKIKKRPAEKPSGNNQNSWVKFIEVAKGIK